MDIGTGDGHFVYQSARSNPHKFYLGIDVNPAALEKISEKAHRKPAKGGAPNLLFVHSPVENLPVELSGVADEIHIHFPWGSLLRAVYGGEETVLRGLRRICAPDALLEVVIGVDQQRDRSEIDRLGLENISEDHLRCNLTPRYAHAGFEVYESGVLQAGEWPCLNTAWAKRLQMNPTRKLLYLIAHAV